MRPALVVMARAPRPGTVKTRLAGTVGEARALAVYRELAEDTLGVARAAGVHVTVSFAPSDAGDEMREWLGADVSYEPQCDGELGARMAGAIAARFTEGYDRVAVIGTDCPTITTGTIHDALSTLERADAVFGPAHDGGYYLVALRAPHVTLFQDVPWSSPRTLAVTLRRAEAAGLHVELLERMRDVDTADDWAWHQRGRQSGSYE